MTTSRERVLQALNHHIPDRTPRDLGGMRSTSISAFVYPKLVQALGLPSRRPKVEDTGQMLALPDLDVLDALGCDVVTILDGVTNAFDQPELWQAYDFNGRLPALVRWPGNFRTLDDGTIFQWEKARMLPDAFVFDEEHAGQPLDLSADLPKMDLEAFRYIMEVSVIRDDQIIATRQLCQRVRESTDRAVFFNDGMLQTMMGIGSFSGVAVFPMLCLTEPDYVTELHEIITERCSQNIRRLLPEIENEIDILMLAADDWGMQNSLFASPEIFRKLFLPYYRRLTDECHRIAPEVKIFLHSCGAIYDLIDLIIEAGFDVLNPVQWSAGGRPPCEWKEKARGRIALWGGGVNAQATLPFGSVEEVRREAREAVRVLGEGGGYIFCNIHNILAEIPPEKVIALYQAGLS